MTGKPTRQPKYLRLLPDSSAGLFLTEGLLTGEDDVKSIQLDGEAQPLPEEKRFRWDGVRDLLEDAMYEFGETRTAADAWLAPRLHATLRLTRVEAADPGLWNYLALGVAPDYVHWRHNPSGERPAEPTAPVPAERFKGPHYKQAFARLWWTAELFRDGPDYTPVVTACGIQDILNFAIRLEVMDHRPTAQAVVRLLTDGTVRTGRETNALAAAVNAAASTLFLDALAPDVDRNPTDIRAWSDGAEDAMPVNRRILPGGPDEERTPKESVEILAEQFRELFDEAPVRGSRPVQSGD
ncbi:DUF6339 family protein [Streptomyces iconiensis]|uniref:DUF6339 family protein n=1 Tax=Streptomyces iconiensis TaxID=1384038 RepID=A0ABT7A094_9ACTN|nr:DUF6339 family protein [Streptomyces iconiensis]MDJ1134502.1 DUF6339 family protein [Streptomyces iconiensis]